MARGALWHVESSWTRDQAHVPCIDSSILDHWTTWEVHNSIYKWHHIVYVFFFLTSLSMTVSRSTHPCFCKWHYFIAFYAWVVFHCVYVYLIHSSVGGHLSYFCVLALVNSAFLWYLCFWYHGDYGLIERAWECSFLCKLFWKRLIESLSVW